MELLRWGLAAFRTTAEEHGVDVVGHRKLQQFWHRHADCESSLRAWYRIVSSRSWRNLVELRETFPHADPVDDFTVFNIKGNRYRLITKIDYERQRVYVREVLTHAQYDRNRWRRKG